MPLIPYSRLLPIGEVIVRVAAGAVQVAAVVMATTGRPGTAGTALIVTAVTLETHPVAVLRTVTE